MEDIILVSKKVFMLFHCFVLYILTAIERASVTILSISPLLGNPKAKKQACYIYLNKTMQGTKKVCSPS